MTVFHSRLFYTLNSPGGLMWQLNSPGGLMWQLNSPGGLMATKLSGWSNVAAIFFRSPVVYICLYFQGPLTTAFNSIPKEYTVYVLFSILGLALFMLLVAKFVSR